MSKAAYAGVGGKAHALKALHVGVAGGTRDVIAGYVGVQGKARQFFARGPKVSVSYTGTHTTEDITVGGVACTLYKLTKSGTLTVEGGDVQVWMCSGGARGKGASYDNYAENPTYNWIGYNAGGGGAGGCGAEGKITPGKYTVTIGAASGETSITGPKTIKTNKPSGYINGGTGGGAGGNVYARPTGTTASALSGGRADGSNVIPFGVLRDGYCAGGGGGYAIGDKGYPVASGETIQCGGCQGGTLGSDGKVSVDPPNDVGAGGTKGGGKGGKNANASNATFYGSGGGGAGINLQTTYRPGDGYQGIALVLVPKN